MEWNTKKTLKLLAGLALVGAGAYRVMQKEGHSAGDPIGWIMIGFGSSHLLQEAVRVTDNVMEERHEIAQKEKNRYYPIF
jgi:hypothetical protein